MGLLDGLEGMASQAMGGSDNPNAKVAGGLMAALEEHPGGLQGVMNHMQQNGVDPNQVAAQGTAAPGAVSQGLQGSGLIDMVAQRAGVSPQVAEGALALILPVVMSHFTQGGTTAPPSSGFGGLAGSLLSRFL
jgi:uncharacterized protein YidB (DUF937 family)